MQIQKDVLLAPLTTLRVGGPAKYFVNVTTGEEAAQAFQLAKQENLPLYIMAGGSNMVVADRGLDAVVLHPHMRGIDVLHEDASTITLRTGAGEVWDDVVAHAAAHSWWGIENLSAIPGSTGAAPIQNIGAYGQEVKDTISHVHTLDMHTGNLTTFTNAECTFAYRQSRFNTTDRGRYLVLAVDFMLHKNGTPNLSYKDLQQYFDGRPAPSITEVRNAVTTIRDNKLHNPVREGNAGSFFKNKLVTEAEFNAAVTRMNPILSEKLQQRLESFRTTFRSGDHIKIPAGFLIEACGLMGAAHGGMAVSDRHALVLINKTGTATADDALQLAAHVIHTVYTQTGLTLEVEPNFLGFTPDEMNRLHG